MTNLSLLFWNTMGRDLRHRIAHLAHTRSVDVLILAENEMSPAELVALLNSSGNAYLYHPDNNPRLAVFSRLPPEAVAKLHLEANGHATYRRVKFQAKRGLLLIAVHLPSLLHWSRDDQTLFATRLARHIETAEVMVGHSNTVVMGDFNMTPFDPGMAGAGALHAVMSARVAARETRVVTGQEEPMFYNPMWSCLGDRTPGPPGSYYLRSSKPLNYFWFLLDQVLLRPAIASALTAVEILDHDGQESLLTANGLPDLTNGSDHLPLLVRLQFLTED